MANRNYTDDDYGSCRYVLENRTNMRATVATLGPLTVARAQRLILLKLANGALTGVADGFPIRLAGLGEKTAAEAVRLQKPAVT